MTIDRTSARATSPGRASEPPGLNRGRRNVLVALGVLAAAIVAWLCTYTRTGEDDPRVAAPTLLTPRPETLREFAGLSVHGFWIPLLYAGTVAMMVGMVIAFVRHKQRTGRHHAGLLIFVALYPQVLADPIYNWAAFAVYDPELWHWPVNWPIMDIAPTVEPVWITLGAYQIYFLAPAMAFRWVFVRYVAPRAPMGSYIQRHPKLSLFGFAFGLGLAADFFGEVWALHVGVWTYTQIAGPALSLGGVHLPMFEVMWIGLLIGAVAVLLHRDDNGQSTSARVAKSLKMGRLGEFGATAVIVTVLLALYGGFLSGLRLTGLADYLVTPWPYPSTKVYDPEGRLEKAGVPGPYFGGVWCIDRSGSCNANR